MAFPTLARRLQRTHLQHLSPLVLLQPRLTSASLLSQSSHFSFSQAFHQTLSIPSRNSPLQTLRFSTLQRHPSETLGDPFEFNPERIQIHDELQDPGLLRFFKQLEQVAKLLSEAEAMASLDESGIEPSRVMVRSAIWALRKECRLAFLAFKWGDRWGCCDEEAWNLMIWVLGTHRKFNSAWCLIRDLHRSSMDTRRAMLVMIDRYACANDPCKAIWTFHIMEKFRLSPDQGAFHMALRALCKHGFIEEAEEFMFVNKKLFPLEIGGFNIILNGWCNIFVDVSEAKRVWREMSKVCITPDAISYTHMIACFSKVGNLFDSLRLYDEMKKMGWVPSVKVYNSLVYVLTRENCLKEALKFLEKMIELGLQPDSATYNSIIGPLCKARKLEEARIMLATMLGENVSPTIETYHALLESVEFEETLEILSRMKKAKLGPSNETFIMVLEKFFTLEQPENAIKIWEEMKDYELMPDSTHYTIMVKGLANCGLFCKAKEFLAAMRSGGFFEDPKLKRLLK
ncbi:Pentatricopeptide repeat [Trema orientale]|uniref:Pentatricopeptide repeat n=1 Tax=Trema orientale TaxID=63057 RepID=A0A2P5EUV4_TREOI|nr:Pentatricopeptide repeat [Trema orientale]